MTQAVTRPTLLQRMTSMPLRTFAVYPQIIEPRSAAGLEEIGRNNLALTKESGLDYDTILKNSGQRRIAIKNKPTTFRSFEDEINQQYAEDMKLSEPAHRDTRRVGLVGYKMGMTHFWDRWGALVPCTVI